MDHVAASYAVATPQVITVQRFDLLFCKNSDNTLFYIAYRRIVLYTVLTCWFVASWLFGLAYFLDGGDVIFLWWTLLVCLAGDLLATALTIVDRVVWKEHYIDVVWYLMSFLIYLAPAGFAIAAATQVYSSAEGMVSTALIMILVPMGYTFVEAIVRCVNSKVQHSQTMEVIQ